MHFRICVYFGLFGLKKFIPILLSLCYHICIWIFVSSDHPECFNGLNTLNITHKHRQIFQRRFYKYSWIGWFTIWNMEHFKTEQIVHLIHSNFKLLHPLIIFSVTTLVRLQSESMGLFALKCQNSRQNSSNLYAVNSFSWIAKSYFLDNIRV